MSEYSDRPPRSSKRRRIAKDDAAVLLPSGKTHDSFANLQDFSDDLSSLQQTLLPHQKHRLDEILHNDSTYGSKEDSLVEEESGGSTVEISHTALDTNAVRTARGRTPNKPSKENRSPAGATSCPKIDKRGTPAEGKPQMEPVVGDVPRRSSRRSTQNVPRAAEALSHQVEGTTPGVTTPSKRRNTSVQRRLADEGGQNKEAALNVENKKHRRSSKEVDSADKLHVLKQNNQQSQKPESAESMAENDSTQRRSSGRNRRRNQRYSINDGETQPLTQQAPKGILTPSRKGKAAPRKTVVFEHQKKQHEVDLGFRDIVSPVEAGHLEPLDSLQTAESLQGKVLPTDSAYLWQPIANHETQSESVFDLVSDSELASSKLLVSEIEDSDSITAVKAEVLAKLTSRKQSPNLSHLQDQYSSLQTLLKATVAAGESNSLLLLGSRGSGKTLLVETALSSLIAEHSGDFHIVRLSGFLQTDDKQAVKEIWRQLGREMQVSEDDTNEMSSYADMMASLLGLLAHPEELPSLSGVDADGIESRRTAKSVVFILDEFDLFTSHPRQTLLYNLFDIAQARKAPIAVIGCSTRMDVIDCLEKRVKSRFSHRWVHVPTCKSFSAWEALVTSILCVADGEKSMISGKFQDEVDVKWRRRWNDHIKSTFLSALSTQALLKQIFYTTKALPDLFGALYIPVATISISEATATVTDTPGRRKSGSKRKPSTSNTTTKSPPSTSNITFSTVSQAPSIMTFLPFLPVLHLTLLTAAARLESIHSLPHVNFHITYAHYLDLISRIKQQQHHHSAVALRVWGREVALGAWEELGSWEILCPVVGGVSGPKSDEGVSDKGKMWRVDVTLEEVAWAVNVKSKREGTSLGGMGEVLGRWGREV